MKDIIFLFNKKFHFVVTAIFKMTAIMVFFNGLLLFTKSVKIYSDALGEKSDIVVVLKEDITSEQQSFVDFKLGKIPSIQQFKFVNPQEADSVFLKSTGEDVKNILGYNPVPGCFFIRINPNVNEYAAVESIVREIREYPGVYEVALEPEYGRLKYEILPRAVTYLLLFCAGAALFGTFIISGIAKEAMHLITEGRKRRQEKGLKTPVNKSSAMIFCSSISIFSGVFSFVILWLLWTIGFIKPDINLTGWEYIFTGTLIAGLVTAIISVLRILLLVLPKNNTLRD
ncbi:MAG: hypothetical protein HYV28_00595 [Ignavibacteriales bacterium]|nr:hypothetical protein [Ignavibacteriales bacterium]